MPLNAASQAIIPARMEPLWVHPQHAASAFYKLLTIVAICTNVGLRRPRRNGAARPVVGELHHGHPPRIAQAFHPHALAAVRIP